MSKSAELCIAERDIKTAYKNYVNATPRWKEYWYNTCKEILEHPKCRKADKNRYKVHPRLKTIEKVPLPKVKATNISWDCPIPEDEEGKEQVYIVEFLGRKNECIIWGKVGTTTRTILQRILEELKYYYKDGVRKAIIRRAYDCGDVPAESLESYIRAHFSKVNPTTFKKNDRFKSLALDPLVCDRLYEEWLAI